MELVYIWKRTDILCSHVQVGETNRQNMWMTKEADSWRPHVLHGARPTRQIF